ncbi:ParB N-terminal domain-containing protein [Nocardioides sp. B-3]|uniref:ParB N-terminal domain-containing protein n=1 Tax=Nocardioides sp. B-3 TaxID=2895565 RepID=UPI00300E4F98
MRRHTQAASPGTRPWSRVAHPDRTPETEEGVDGVEATGSAPTWSASANGSLAEPSAPTDGVPYAGTVAGAYFADLPIARVRPNHRQPRQVFDEEALAELVHSITEVGLLQPVVVRKTGVDEYELIMGERRWRLPCRGPRRPSPRSCVRPTTTTCSAMRCWRTCTAPS